VELGEWLFKEDEYNPQIDKDKFVDKSIFSILKVLSKIRREDTMDKVPGIYALNPVLKFLFTIILIVFISLSRSAVYISAVCVLTLLSMLFLQREDYKRIFSIVLIFSIFTAIMLVPSMLIGNFKNSMLMVLKVFTTITLANILSHSTKWNELAKALKLLFIPDIFILVLELTLRYIYILGEAAMEMLYALKLRSVGRNNKKYNSLSGIAGSLFLRSKDMGEELYSAMECRGFTGEYTSTFNRRIVSKDIIYIIYNVLIITAYFVI
jgi:cobalt/nickel transport system permease protein